MATGKAPNGMSSSNWATVLLVSAPDSHVQAAHAPALGLILSTLLDNAAQATGQIRLDLLIAPEADWSRS